LRRGDFGKRRLWEEETLGRGDFEKGRLWEEETLGSGDFEKWRLWEEETLGREILRRGDFEKEILRLKN
jgi:hypothetical protein